MRAGISWRTSRSFDANATQFPADAKETQRPASVFDSDLLVYLSFFGHNEEEIMIRHDREKPEDTIKRLENELWTARQTILEILPAELHMLLLNSYSGCKSREETCRWENMVAEKLLDHVKVISYDLQRDRERAYCPLCGSGSQEQDKEGFTLPVGLQHHITGYGSTRKCPVVEQIRYLAKEHWDNEFAEQECGRKYGGGGNR